MIRRLFGFFLTESEGMVRGMREGMVYWEVAMAGRMSWRWWKVSPEKVNREAHS